MAGPLAVLAAICIAPLAAAQNLQLMPASSAEGYLARVLINETAFPGEPGYRSEADSKAGMLAVLWVLHCRIHHVPEGYTQREIAAVESRSILDVITAGDGKGQVDGFYRDRQGRLRAAPRVDERVRYLVDLANQGAPGRVSRLLNHAQHLASRYYHVGPGGPDIFKDIRQINATPVTGRSYSWMADRHRRSPGERYVRIPNALGGLLGGNRFFTLRDEAGGSG
jgi:hypothetical protein